MVYESGVQIIKIGNVKDQIFDYKNSPSYVDISFYDKYSTYQLKIGDILISMTGTAGKRDYGNVCMVDIAGKYLLNQRVGKVEPNSKILRKYLFFVLNQNETKDKFYFNATGGVRQGNISNKQIEAIEINLPSIDIQKQIVEKIEAEKLLVESNKKLIEIYEQKMKEVISKLWN
jgi:restriction endonuclease S subunit